VFNKWDLVEGREDRAKDLQRQVRSDLPHIDYAPAAFVSALTGRGVSAILPLIDRVRESELRRIPTPELNRFLQSAVQHLAPRARGGKEVKLLYMTQAGVAPPRFLVFASRIEGIDPSYTRFLVRRLREEFGFEGTPIRLRWRKRRPD
jgi:GTP-binding protein